MRTTGRTLSLYLLLAAGAALGLALAGWVANVTGEQMAAEAANLATLPFRHSKPLEPRVVVEISVRARGKQGAQSKALQGTVTGGAIESVPSRGSGNRGSGKYVVGIVFAAAVVECAHVGIEIGIEFSCLRGCT